MKRHIHHVMILLVLLLAGACTQYNGHIGPIFGSWALDSVTEDGILLQPSCETVFSFQNEVVRVVGLEDPPFKIIERYGNFKLSDDILTLKFEASPTESEKYLYMTPDWLYLPLDGEPIVFDIRKLNGSSMVLELRSGETTRVYSFRKTW